LPWTRVNSAELLSQTLSFEIMSDEPAFERGIYLDEIVTKFLKATCQQVKTNKYDIQAAIVCATRTRLKPGFHYPSSRPEYTARVDGPCTRVHFLTPVNSGRQLGW